MVSGLVSIPHIASNGDLYLGSALDTTLSSSPFPGQININESVFFPISHHPLGTF